MRAVTLFSQEASLNILRFIGNLLLAIVLIALIAAILLLGGGMVLSRTWETAGLDESAEGGQWLWIEAQPIYYRIWGGENSSTVVLVHGFDVGGSATWLINGPALAKSGLRVVAVDLKGFGHSVRDPQPHYSLDEQALLLGKALNELHISNATVVGCGWGGAVASQLAREQPQFVKQLVLISPSARNSAMLWKSVADIPYLGRAVVWTWACGPLRWLEQRLGFYNPKTMPKDYAQQTRQSTHIVGTTDALLAMARSSQKSEVASFPRAQVPTVILLGERDFRTALEEGRHLQQAWPGARLVTIPDAGHYVHIEQSAQVNHLLAELCLQEIH